MSEALTTTTTSMFPKEELAKALAQRPDRDELVGRNILPSEWASCFPTGLSILTMRCMIGPAGSLVDDWMVWLRYAR